MVKKTIYSDNKNLSVNLEEYFDDKEERKEVIAIKELFKADNDVDIKTDLSYQEIVLINTLMFNDRIIKRAKLRPLYKNFLASYLRLKISKDRLSRQEFVNMNRGESNTENVLDTMSKINNITGVKKW